MTTTDQAGSMIRQSFLLVVMISVTILVVAVVSYPYLGSMYKSWTGPGSVTSTLLPTAMSLSGTVVLETFEPLCASARPPCKLPTLIMPVLVTGEGTLYLLKSSDPDIQARLIDLTGMVIVVTGAIELLDPNQYHAAYSCSPYSCNLLSHQVWVVSIVSVSR